MALPPGPPHSAIVNTILYATRPEKFLRDCHARYGNVFRFSTVIFGEEVGVVRPEAIKKIFTGDADQLRAGEANAPLEPILGQKSVLLLDGPEHIRQRRLILPPFHGERMTAYATTMREITERTIDGWPDRKRFTLHGHMQKVTLEIILRTIFGIEDRAKLDDLGAGIAGLLDRVSSPISMFGTVPALRRDAWGLSPWARFKRQRARVDEKIYAEIARRRVELAKEGAAERTDVLSLLMSAKDEAGEHMTDVELRDELMTLLTAGHETTATELCWAFDMILREPAVLAKIKEEHETGAPFEKRPYLDAVVKEVLRIRPVIPAVGRRVQKAMTFEGYDIPAGTLLVPSIWLTHFLPDVYPDPESFRPERFLDTKPDPYSFLPFGGGIRRCIGMAFALFEMKVVIATVLARVRLQLVEPQRAKVGLRSFTHAPRGNVPVTVEERLREKAPRPRPVVAVAAAEAVSPATAATAPTQDPP